MVCEINNESDNMIKKSLIVKFCFLYFLIELIEQHMTFDIDFVKNDCHDPRPPRRPRPPLPPLQTQLMLMKHIYNGSIFNTQKHCVFRHITNYLNRNNDMKFNSNRLNFDLSRKSIHKKLFSRIFSQRNTDLCSGGLGVV